jgi:hypothetical protein
MRCPSLPRDQPRDPVPRPRRSRPLSSVEARTNSREGIRGRRHTVWGRKAESLMIREGGTTSERRLLPRCYHIKPNHPELGATRPSRNRRP